MVVKLVFFGNFIPKKTNFVNKIELGKMNLLLPQLDSVLFWDTEKEQLNEEEHADYIIRRVFELGDIAEIIVTHAFYGTERCRKALLTAPYLRETAIVQGMVFLDITKRSAFISFDKKQYHTI